jgi:hypothetical protein
VALLPRAEVAFAFLVFACFRGAAHISATVALCPGSTHAF